MIGRIDQKYYPGVRHYDGMAETKELIDYSHFARDPNALQSFKDSKQPKLFGRLLQAIIVKSGQQLP